MALQGSIVRSFRFKLLVGLGLILIAGVWLDHRGEDRFDQLLARVRARGQPTTVAELQRQFPFHPLVYSNFLRLEAVCSNLTSFPPLLNAWLGEGRRPDASTRPLMAAAGVPAATGWLEENSATLEQLLPLLAEESNFGYHPRANDPDPMPRCYLATRGFCARAALAHDRGDVEQGADNMVAALRLLRWHRPSFMEVAARIQTVHACAMILDPMLREGRLPGRQQEQMEQAVGDLLKSPTFHAVLRREWVESAELLALESCGITRWWTETEWQGKIAMMAYALSGLKRSEMAALGELGDENAEVFVGPMAERQARDLVYQQRIWAVSRRLWHPKAGIIIASYSELMKKELWQQGWLQSVATMLAVERFRRHHGHLPAALIELVPKFLAGVPTDPNDGRPLRYRVTPSGYVVYSVGLDGVDDGGQAEGIPDEGFAGPWSGDTAIETSTVVRPSSAP